MLADAIAATLPLRVLLTAPCCLAGPAALTGRLAVRRPTMASQAATQ
jgi:hypothetical protein